MSLVTDLHLTMMNIDGYYVLTKNYKLFYNLEEQFQTMERWQSG